MSRIDIAELNDFLHGLRSSNAEAKAMIRKIKEAAMDYAQDDRLKGGSSYYIQTIFYEYLYKYLPEHH